MGDEEELRARRETAVARFTELVGEPEPALDETALEIAVAAEPTHGPEAIAAARGELDRLADGVVGFDGLRHRLYSERGFAGATEDYYDPRNSSLIQVLARRTGIPITLAVVCLEVGRRAGVALEPVGMPGHFLVRPVGTDVHLDPFTGDLLDRAACEARFRASTGTGPEVPFDPARMLAAIDHRAVLVRMLTNLRVIHRAHGRLIELRWLLTMRMALPGVRADEVLELAETSGRRAAFREAAALLEGWADDLPRDAARLRRHARSWRAHLN